MCISTPSFYYVHNSIKMSVTHMFVIIINRDRDFILRGFEESILNMLMYICQHFYNLSIIKCKQKKFF
jgi:hypothetical protein